MAPLAPSNTGRYFVDYTVLGHEHTAVVRANAVVSPAGLGTSLDALFTSLNSLLYTLTLTRVRWAASGSNVSNIVTTGFEGEVYGAGTSTDDSVPLFMDFIGRSTGGRRARFSIFGYKGLISTYRVSSSEHADVAAAVAIVNGPANAWLAIDGIKAVWYPYVNVGYNAYWQRAVRA